VCNRTNDVCKVMQYEDEQGPEPRSSDVSSTCLGSKTHQIDTSNGNSKPRPAVLSNVSNSTKKAKPTGS
jgi:hypothetical protein